ncbi:uncharacterized protein KGF55_003077 [Candida pseudojiufengensis]|uniref:uncharacterized protein n=1 Tax=Candida pseudojiufengensis TaxID=497109 RepID=UPI002225652B|nr:uncharacterized protein KGF55_003077 [Candida pseudojiufengensis]KAI5963285.1 hypothetical protein KGF55_003077 [Candida pseudojiufengensis]
MFQLTILILAVGFLVYQLCTLYKSNKQNSINPILQNITAIDSKFQWQNQTPLKIRPFVGKTNFNPSMGIKKISHIPNEWLLIEDTYLKCTSLKQQSLNSNPNQTMYICNDPSSINALKEFYDLVFEFYIKRYPQYFIYNKSLNEVTNAINGFKFKLNTKHLTPKQMLINLGSNMEEDFILMLKPQDSKNKSEEEYILKSTIVGFPAGFDASELFNKPISFIHNPVPQYTQRLKPSMNKFFNNLSKKDLWIRFNWSIQTHSNYFTLSNHGRIGDKPPEKLKRNEIDFKNGCFLRCERQILFRLPKSNAIIMTTRTYLTSLFQIKKEGLSKDLIFGIRSLPDDLAFYKKRHVWDDAVIEYLSREEDKEEQLEKP